MFRVEVVSIGMDQATHSPVLILKKKEGEEAFTLPLSHFEAAGIAGVLRGKGEEGPATHHLFADFIRHQGYRMLRAEIRDLQDRRGRARILLGADLEDRITMETRISDAIAMALCFDAPVFLSVEEAQNTTGIPGEVRAMDESTEGKKWTAFLEKLDADRFGNA